MDKSSMFLEHAKVRIPLICGAMYPCSNPALISAVASAGALAIVQPVSLVFAHKTPFQQGLREIMEGASAPVGVNLLIEASSKTYLERNRRWLEEALELGVRFFVTALGNPKDFVARVKAYGGFVYHDVTERKWAEKALEAGVDGLICVNNRAGGHAGTRSPLELFQDLQKFGVPLVCAGGVGSESEFVDALSIGYQAVQMGTRFIATKECTAHEDYKKAIVQARAKDIVLSRKITGVPVSIIETAFVKKVGTKPNFLADLLLRNGRTKHLARTFYSLRSLFQLRSSNRKGNRYGEYYQAGKSVEHIEGIEPAGAVIDRFHQAWSSAQRS